MKRLWLFLAILSLGTVHVAATAADAPGVKVPAHQRFVMPNGLTIVLVPKKEVPLIAFSGFVRGGSLADPAETRRGFAGGWLLDRGAGKRSAFEFADALEGVAARWPPPPGQRASMSEVSSWRAIVRS